MPRMDHCPFHDDRSPSLAIYEETDSFYCFAASCGATGSLKELKKAKKGIGGIVPRIAKAQERPKRSPQEITEAFETFLKERRLEGGDITKAGGYLDFVDNPGYLWLPTVKGRVGRNLFEGEPRYLNDGLPLFGDLSSKNLLLVEGSYDALQLNKANFPSVSAGGAKPSPEALYRLKDKTLNILFDADYAGWRGARRVAEKLNEFRARYQILDMPSSFGKDPQEALLKKPEDFGSWLKPYLSPETEIEWAKKEFSERLDYVSFGIEELDNLLKGIAPSSVIGIAGNTEAGKTALAVAIARNIAEQGKSVGICTYEISKRQYYSRLLSPYIGREWRDLEEEGFSKKDLEALANNHILDRVRVKVSPRLGEILTLADTSDVLIIDYAQCVPIKAEDLHRGFRDFIESLIELAVKRNKIIIMLSSMARAAYNNSTTMAVFKDFGDLEYRLAAVLRLSKYGKDRVATMKVRVLKSTRGVRGGKTVARIPFDYGYNMVHEEPESDIAPWE